MEYTVIVNGRSYDLPAKNLSVAEQLDAVLKTDSVKGLSITQKYERLHRFVQDLVGEKDSAEMLGSSNLAEIDLSDLTLTVRRIVDAYDKPIDDYEAEKTRNQMNRVPIDKVVSLTKALQTVEKPQGMQKW